MNIPNDILLDDAKNYSVRHGNCFVMEDKKGQHYLVIEPVSNGDIVVAQYQDGKGIRLSENG